MKASKDPIVNYSSYDQLMGFFFWSFYELCNQALSFRNKTLKHLNVKEQPE